MRALSIPQPSNTPHPSATFLPSSSAAAAWHTLSTSPLFTCVWERAMAASDAVTGYLKAATEAVKEGN